jgi:hypothetical protein
LAILAQSDRIVDNKKFLEFTAHMFNQESRNRLAALESAHAVQFEKSSELAGQLYDFIQNLDS